MAQQFCTKCGERLEPGAKFCTKCGETIKEPIKPVDPDSSMRKLCFIISLVMLGLTSFFVELVFIPVRKIFIILGCIFLIVVSSIFEVLTILTFKGAKFKKHFMYYVAMSLLGIECIASVVFLIFGIVR